MNASETTLKNWMGPDGKWKDPAGSEGPPQFSRDVQTVIYEKTVVTQEIVMVRLVAKMDSCFLYLVMTQEEITTA